MAGENGQTYYDNRKTKQTNMSQLIERIIHIININGANSHSFAKKTGIDPSNLKKMLDGKQKISDKTVGKIANAYHISRNWLLHGDGEMIHPSESTTSTSYDSETATKVLLLPLHTHGNPLKEFKASAQASDCERIVSPVQGADFAIQITGDSMAPEYPSGARILIKKIDENAFIEWGRTYVLDTCNGVVVKNLFPTENPSVVQCRSANTDYPPFNVDMCNVYGVYRVLLCMSIK